MYLRSRLYGRSIDNFFGLIVEVINFRNVSSLAGSLLFGLRVHLWSIMDVIVPSAGCRDKRDVRYFFFLECGLGAINNRESNNWRNQDCYGNILSILYEHFCSDLDGEVKLNY